MALHAAPAAGNQVPPIKLQHEYIGMAELPLAPGKSRLAVFEADDARPKRQRWLYWFEKLGGKLAEAGSVRLAPETAAYDVCRLEGPAKAASLLFVKSDGIYSATASEPLARIPTVFAHPRDDALPRVRLCFDLFAGEPPALVVPTLAGVTVFRRSGAGYTKHADIATEASLRSQGLLSARGGDAQRVTLRIEFPDASALDFDGDGLVDLCFNRADKVTCHLQDKASGFAKAATRGRDFALLTPDEEKDTSLRLDSTLVDLDGDGRIDVVLQKTVWNLSDMQTTLYFYPQAAGGTYPPQAAQTLNRKGYFALQEYIDIDGDGRLDLVAPVAALGWSELAGIFLSRSADIDFVWYRNEGGKLAAEARKLHSISWPVDLKNSAAIFGALPIWTARMARSLPAGMTRQVLFFTKKRTLELYGITAKGALGDDPLWRQSAVIGNESLVVDLDTDGRHELVFAYPRDPQRAKTLLFIDSPSG